MRTRSARWSDVRGWSAVPKEAAAAVRSASTLSTASDGWARFERDSQASQLADLPQVVGPYSTATYDLPTVDMADPLADVVPNEILEPARGLDRGPADYEPPQACVSCNFPALR